MIPTVFATRKSHNDLLDKLFNGDSYIGKYEHTSTPDVNVIEYNDKFELQVALPGVAKEDISLNIEENVLTISMERKEVEEEIQYLKKEFFINGFKRAFNIPDEVNQEKIEALQSNGVLTVSMPKIETAINKGPRHIEVK
jgi:HSP20 family protein